MGNRRFDKQADKDLERVAKQCILNTLAEDILGYSNKQAQEKVDFPNIKRGKRRFHIAVIDNRDGKVICDDDTDCICGAYSQNEEDIIRISCSNCNSIELLGVIDAAKKQAEKMLPNDPFIRLLFCNVVK